MKIKAIIHPAEEGGYWAEVPALPGCITEGDSLEEVTHIVISIKIENINARVNKGLTGLECIRLI
jgi:hypothetical protein